jgi:hypothetical protein
MIAGPVASPVDRLKREIAEVEERLLMLRARLASITSPRRSDAKRRVRATSPRGANV